MRIVPPILPLQALPVLAALLLAFPALAQEATPEERLLNSDPQKLLEISQDHRSAITMTSIADFENRDVREAPANVQVITARQIQASGARDLYEALQLVPGISFARDVDDVTGVAIHGNWAEEGKCLFLLDGRQLNENDFGTYGIGMRIPLANVERIEVVMGPGSILNGGYASLGVVNIVTRSADIGTGSRASVQTGYSNNDFTTTQVSISGAHRLSRDQEISYMTSHENGRRSNAFRLLPDSTELNFADSTNTQANTFQFNYKWRDLQATMLYMDQVSAVSDAVYSVEQRDIILGLGFEHKFSRKIEMKARVTHADQLPWYYVNTSDPGQLATNTNNQRTSGRASFIYKPVKWFSSRIGTQVYHQTSTFYRRSSEAVYTLNGKRSINMDDAAVFAELALSGKLGMLNAGYRVEHNSLSGNFAAPRVAYTKVWGPMHMKLLWSQAFKTPTIANLNYAVAGEPLSAETVTTQEAELGFKLFHGLNLTFNGYNTAIDNPIIYVYDDKLGDTYTNRPFSGTTGFDGRMSYESKRFTTMAGFGINQPLADSDSPEMQLPESSSAFQGLPTNRGYFLMAYDVVPSITVRAKATWRDRTSSFQYLSGDTLSLVEWPTELVYNTGITLRPGKDNRLSIDLDCRNITDVARTLVSPNTNATTPFALNGREFGFAITYKFVQ
ncbi:MAG: TonB-dependent receptor plug domain-containing protein [Flavobacteriales bacterium]|jgi:outer membrane cobalamin receptor|nr:TonB-dependent receptor plug domain-containing protein [Flavobacteriales bacterium]MCI1754315.1 TonB-dependent receptor plug domain-containing protein [Flavobacteriales bacterium]